MIKNWFVFIQERFPPTQYLIMIFAFLYAHISYFSDIYSVDLDKIWILFFWTILFFFRLRLFDEIKDYHYDLQVNPNRPLARGLVSVKQTKAMIFFVVIIEFLLISYFKSAYLLKIYAIVFFYSYLMYKEFFVSQFLRRRLATYAVTHTFVCFGISWILAIILKNNNLNIIDYLFLITHWFYFNIFEFARKTYAATEERPNVETYSSLWGPTGAILLSWSQVLMAQVIFYVIASDKFFFIFMPTIFLLLPSMYYLNKNNSLAARYFRLWAGLYLVIHYFVLGLVF